MHLRINQQKRILHNHPKKIYIEYTFQAPLCLTLCSSRQNKRLFAGPSKNDRVDQSIPSCGQQLAGLLSTSSLLRVISPWHSPPCFPPELDFLGQRCNHITIGNYFKHRLMYEDGQFAKHSRFVLNTEMRWHALHLSGPQ